MLYEFKVFFKLIMAVMSLIEKSAIRGSLYIYLSLWLIFIKTTSAEECDQSKCKGPLLYYKDLNCKPIYDESEDCCPIRYDCSHLNGRSLDKCYTYGREYNLGEKLRNEDRSSPCDVSCFCNSDVSGAHPEFKCAAMDCYIFQTNLEEGCHYKYVPDTCCPTEIVCSESVQEAVKCEVDGQIYKDGEPFYPSKNPGIVCQCMEGYTGNNIKPFCNDIKCGLEIHHHSSISDNCVPVFYESQNMLTSCPLAFRCQNNNDTILQVESKHSKLISNTEEYSDEMMCKFGNMVMHIGDELNQGTDFGSRCMKCVCEVPPTPTCQELSHDVCNNSDYA